MSKVSPSEALYGFASWLSSQSKLMVIGSTEDTAPLADAVDQFCKANNLPDPRDGWIDNINHPAQLDDN